jgi:hypothetical protein
LARPSHSGHYVGAGQVNEVDGKAKMPQAK